MKESFWNNLKEPFCVLAPMADVTDISFRQMITKYSAHNEENGGPDVFWTEFVSVDGLLSVGRDILIRDFEYLSNERPIVAQIFGSKPENFEEVAKLISELGFDGIDINMGCPDNGICKQGAGASLIKDPERAKEIIRRTKLGAPHIPVSIKTRIGWTTDETESWIGALLEARPAAITVHARTRKEMSLVPAHWDSLARAVELAKGTGVVMIANGGILTHEEGKRICEETGANGYMCGKAVFGTPWFFDREGRYEPQDLKKRFEIMLEHTKLFMKYMGERGVGTESPLLYFGDKTIEVSRYIPPKNIALMKKHFKAYVNGWSGAKELRERLFEARDGNHICEILDEEILKNS